jgi:DNA-directed RNA polymerase subunit beta'
MKSVFDPETGEKIVGKNVLVDEAMAKKIVDAGVKTVEIRSVFTCNTDHGVCERCYGRNAATGDRVEAGEAVGTVAAQSIGEPGTQLTLRNFHTGGVAGNEDITQGLPRVQEIVEARNPKGRAIISEVTGVVESIEENPAERTKDVTVKGDTDTRTYTLPITARLNVAEGDQIHRGAEINVGSTDPKELLQVTDVLSTETYMLSEVQKVYRLQGIDLLDKHIEIMIRQMMRKVRIMEPGDTDVLPGELMDIDQFREANYKTLISGGIPATARPVILGITKAALETNSFLSAASFQETTRVLTDAAIHGKNDPLVGLKENVIIGKIIPAGTGMGTYRNIKPKIVGQPAAVTDGKAPETLKDIEAKIEAENADNN